MAAPTRRPHLPRPSRPTLPPERSTRRSRPTRPLPTSLLRPRTSAGADTSVAPTGTAPPASAPAGAPPSTIAPDSTAPLPSDISPARRGYVRLSGTEYPILRSCLTQPFAPNGGDYSVYSHLFDTGSGQPQVIEQWFDEGEISGGSYIGGGFAGSDTRYLDFGQDGFGLVRLQDGVTVDVAANPANDASLTPDDCGGTVTIADPATADFVYRRAVVDVCFGAQAGPLQYVGYLSEGGRFTAAPDGGGVIVTYTDPVITALTDPAASTAEIDGGVRIQAAASGDSLSGPVTKVVVITLRNDRIRPCTEQDAAP